MELFRAVVSFASAENVAIGSSTSGRTTEVARLRR